jgi:DNA-directed RNA polymerase specialized sigma subunit
VPNVSEAIQDRFERLLPMAKSLLRTRDEDAIAEASLALWESLSHHGESQDRTHLNRAVAAGRESLRSDDLASLGAEPGCRDNLASCAIVEDLLRILPEIQRRAFVYHCLEGLSAEAVSELLGMSERNVYYLVIKAKRRLWKEIR